MGQSCIVFGAYQFNLEACSRIQLPIYKGSSFRGAFGHALKKVVCTRRDKNCSLCLLKGQCVYSYVFETPPPEGTKIMRKYPAAPHPFIVEPPLGEKLSYQQGENVSFNLVLIGRALDLLPYFIYSFEELGRIGIGRERGKFELKTIRSKSPNGQNLGSKPVGSPEDPRIDQIYSSDTKRLAGIPKSSLVIDTQFPDECKPVSREITLKFETPTRMTFGNRLTRDVEFHIIIRQLLRRLSLLSYFHCGTDISDWKFKDIIRKAEEVKVKENALTWFDWQRYSQRQDQKIEMGGFLGDITFQGDIDPFMPLIRAGEMLHVGKGTVFGLGKYSVCGLNPSDQACRTFDKN